MQIGRVDLFNGDAEAARVSTAPPPQRHASGAAAGGVAGSDKICRRSGYRLGMYLLGQAFFSRELIDNRLKPKSVRTVALCALDDAVLRPIAERYGVEVVVDEVESAVADSGQPLKGPVAAFEAALAALTDEPPRCEPIRPRENGTPSVSALIGRNRAGKEGKGREARPWRCAARSHGHTPGAAYRGRS